MKLVNSSTAVQRLLVFREVNDKVKRCTMVLKPDGIYELQSPPDVVNPVILQYYRSLRPIGIRLDDNCAQSSALSSFTPENIIPKCDQCGKYLIYDEEHDDLYCGVCKEPETSIVECDQCGTALVYDEESEQILCSNPECISSQINSEVDTSEQSTPELDTESGVDDQLEIQQSEGAPDPLEDDQNLQELVDEEGKSEENDLSDADRGALIAFLENLRKDDLIVHAKEIGAITAGLKIDIATDIVDKNWQYAQSLMDQSN